MGAITQAVILAGKLCEDGHLNYGKDGFGYSYQHTAIPRLSCIDRFYKGKALQKAGKRSERLWHVDGAQVADLDEAVVRLAEAPTFSEAEQLFLERVPVDWTELHPLLKALAAEFPEPHPPHSLMWMCRKKGALQVERREAVKASFIRRSPAERDAA